MKDTSDETQVCYKKKNNKCQRQWTELSRRVHKGYDQGLHSYKWYPKNKRKVASHKYPA